ncbi:hypothetical protein L1F30_02665 [Simiduia sp. 21SJ11W-1]|uniref:hypothetical protein n=1 Tax=Simiduia sp. 21SJ11W-1 TaxID=2909669 RepID=UPI00209D7556|nr:hypothetical protein [Simiduia sp. 21SJ11W-1]UTA48457.1 hypothetical protein L1F30_02665 [Simiduia sp. 21SJ11W-1]
MFSFTKFNKSRTLLLAALALCLVFAQAVEVQHDHQQLQTECFLCQHANALACNEEVPKAQRPEPGMWLEISPYHRLHRNAEKRGKRDPPTTREASA